MDLLCHDGVLYMFVVAFAIRKGDLIYYSNCPANCTPGALRGFFICHFLAIQNPQMTRTRTKCTAWTTVGPPPPTPTTHPRKAPLGPPTPLAMSVPCRVLAKMSHRRLTGLTGRQQLIDTFYHSFQRTTSVHFSATHICLHFFINDSVVG